MLSRQRALLMSAPSVECCRWHGYNKVTAGAIPMSISHAPALYRSHSSAQRFEALVTAAMHNPESTSMRRSNQARPPSLTTGHDLPVNDPLARVNIPAACPQPTVADLAEECRSISCPPNVKQRGSGTNLPWRGRDNTLNLGNGDLDAILSRSLSSDNCVNSGSGHRQLMQNHLVTLVQGLQSDTSAHTLRFAPTSRRRIPHPTSVTVEPCSVQQGQGDTGIAVNRDVNEIPRKHHPIESTKLTTSVQPSHNKEESIQNHLSEGDERPASQPTSRLGLPTDSDRSGEDRNSGIAQEDTIVETDEDKSTEKHIPLSYQIPKAKLRAAMQASPNTKACFWSQTLYSGPAGENISTHYLRDFATAERVAKYFLKEKVVGFDIEWKPWGSKDSIKQNASLIQLACENRIALFHISQFKGRTPQDLVPPTLRAVLESPDILKVGVAVKGDFSRVTKYLDIHPRGVFELSRLHNLVEYYEVDRKKVTHKLVSLAKLVHHHLQLPLYKGEQLEGDDDLKESVRESDWSKALTIDQIHYAAADAYAGFRLFDVLEGKRKSLKQTPPWPRLCDHDPKLPTPKETATTAKVERNKVKARAVAEKTATKEKGEEREEHTDIEAEESEEEREIEEEECMDSHELEDSEVEQDEHISESRKRVGRVNLFKLSGPDLGYPNLPGLSEDDADSDSPAAFGPPPERQLPRQTYDDTTGKALPQDVDAGDEYADPELEEAFVSMDIDVDGKIKDRIDEAPSPSEARVARTTTTVPPATEGKSSERKQAFKPKEDTLSSSLFLSTTGPPETGDPTFDPLIPSQNTDPHTPEYHLATTWAQNYLTSTIPAANAGFTSTTTTKPPRTRANISTLRAYHLWHHQKLPLIEVAKNLRDPPLAQSTVSNYILQAISLERLECADDELRDVLAALPANVRKGRWAYLVRRVGESTEKR